MGKTFTLSFSQIQVPETPLFCRILYKPGWHVSRDDLKTKSLWPLKVTLVQMLNRVCNIFSLAFLKNDFFAAPKHLETGRISSIIMKFYRFSQHGTILVNFSAYVTQFWPGRISFSYENFVLSNRFSFFPPRLPSHFYVTRILLFISKHILVVIIVVKFRMRSWFCSSD